MECLENSRSLPDGCKLGTLGHFMVKWGSSVDPWGCALGAGRGRVTLSLGLPDLRPQWVHSPSPAAPAWLWVSWQNRGRGVFVPASQAVLRKGLGCCVHAYVCVFPCLFLRWHFGSQRSLQIHQNCGNIRFLQPITARLLCLILVFIKWIMGGKRKEGKRSTLILCHLLSGSKPSSFSSGVSFWPGNFPKEGSGCPVSAEEARLARPLMFSVFVPASFLLVTWISGHHVWSSGPFSPGALKLDAPHRKWLKWLSSPLSQNDTCLEHRWGLPRWCWH